jgi:branched-chain amino acid transport system ATP-binding protein
MALLELRDVSVVFGGRRQNANVSLSIADRGYVLSTGRLVLEGLASELRENEDLRRAYLGR